jgi:hypothetical protein
MSQSTESQTWTPPTVGSPCWVEIPAVDVQACKVLSSPISQSNCFSSFATRYITDIPYQQKFYNSLFPSWEWKPATEKYPDEKLAMFSFGGKSGIIRSPSRRDLILTEYVTGLGGGILQVPAECKAGTELKNGLGTTVYHFVDSIESVCPSCRYFGILLIGAIIDAM